MHALPGDVKCVEGGALNHLAELLETPLDLKKPEYCLDNQYAPSTEISNLSVI